MAKKLSEESLDTVSGGDFCDDVANSMCTCVNSKCGKTFKRCEGKFTGGALYCPYCGTLCKLVD